MLEVIIVSVMLVILTGVSAYIFNAALLTWSSQEMRSGIDINLDRGIEEMARDLREARQIQSSGDEIRFTQGASAYYIYYLYNANDAYPPGFSQASYQLKKAALSAGINGNFTYGSGQPVVSDVLSPPASDLSFSANIATIDLSVRRGEETIRSRTKVKPRNL